MKHGTFSGNTLLLLLMVGCMVFGLPGMTNAASTPALMSMEPDQITFGNPATVSLSLSNLPSETMVALQPAAPFAADAMQLPQPPRFLAKHNDVIFAATADTIYTIRFQANIAQPVGMTLENATLTALQTMDQYLIAATETGELLVYTIGTTDELTFKQKYSLGGPITAIAATAGKVYALVAQGNLQILSLTDAGTPAARIALQGRFNALTVKDTYCYLSGDETGVQAIDVSNLSKPQAYPGFTISGSGQAIAIDNQFAYVAGGSSGMTVFDVSDPQHIQWLGSHSKMGPVYGVAVYQGLIAIVNNNNERLVSLDVSNPLLPITDSIYTPRGLIHDMLVDWPYVYVASDYGVERVDFSSSAAIQISNEGINQGGSRRAFIHDNIAYVADWFSGLHIYDISIPNAPRHLGNFHTQGSSKGVVVRDNIAFVGDDDHGLQIIDVSDPQQPRKISEVLTSGLAYTMKLVDNLIYLADHRGGFDIIDVSDLHHPKIIGRYDTPGKSWAIDVAGDIAYVADDSSGLLVFDVHDPGAIALIGQFNPGGYAEDVKISGGQAYVAFFDKGFYILDISSPRQPQLTGYTPIPGNARSICLDGPYAYVAGWESGMQVVDIHKLSAPKIVAQFDTDGSAWGVDVYKKHAYIWDWWGGIKVIDISNPLQPQAAGRYHGKGLIQHLAITGDYLYTADGAGGMQVYDIKNPLNPIWTTGLDVSGSVRDIALAGPRAYLAAEDAGIIIADIANPFYARWLGRVTTPGEIHRLVGDESLLIAADEHAGLLVVDVSQSKTARIKSRLPVKSNDLWLQQRRLYLSSAQGLTVYQITPQLQLRPMARYSTQREANWVRMSGDTIVLGEAGRGIHLLQLHDDHITPVGFFAYTGVINDLQVSAGHLFAASDATGVLDIDISDPKTPTLTALYPNTVVMGPMAVNAKAIFVAGDKTVNSVSRLGDIALQRTPDSDIQLQLPAGLPMGNYQLSLVQPNGNKVVLEKTLSVKPAKRKKPKFTMDDFKKILEQQKLNKQKNAK